MSAMSNSKLKKLVKEYEKIPGVEDLAIINDNYQELIDKVEAYLGVIEKKFVLMVTDQSS
ncbi:hypothetical protein ES705_23692 [subsurface metagenome]